jgi:hypothetical protein
LPDGTLIPRAASWRVAALATDALLAPRGSLAAVHARG